MPNTRQVKGLWARCWSCPQRVTYIPRVNILLISSYCKFSPKKECVCHSGKQWGLHCKIPPEAIAHFWPQLFVDFPSALSSPSWWGTSLSWLSSDPSGGSFSNPVLVSPLWLHRQCHSAERIHLFSLCFISVTAPGWLILWWIMLNSSWDLSPQTRSCPPSIVT